jgi:hypothetical protein
MSFDMQNYKDSFGIEAWLGENFRSFTGEFGIENQPRGHFSLFRR